MKIYLSTFFYEHIIKASPIGLPIVIHVQYVKDTSSFCSLTFKHLRSIAYTEENHILKVMIKAKSSILQVLHFHLINLNIFFSLIFLPMSRNYFHYVLFDQVWFSVIKLIRIIFAKNSSQADTRGSLKLAVRWKCYFFTPCWWLLRWRTNK